MATKEQLQEINRIMEYYKKIGFKLINKQDNRTLAAYYLEQIYESNLSFFDYSFYNYMPFPYYGNIGRMCLMKLFAGIDKEKTEEILSREDKTKEKAEEIIKKIADNNLDIIDYYKMTKLSPIFLNSDFAKYKRNPIICDLFKGLTTDTTTLEKEERITFISSGIEVPQELKELAFKELEEQKLPLTNATYRALVRRKIKREKNMI